MTNIGIIAKNFVKKKKIIFFLKKIGTLTERQEAEAN